MSYNGRPLSLKVQKILIEGVLHALDPAVYRETIQFNNLQEVLDYVNDFYQEDGIAFTEDQLRGVLTIKETLPKIFPEKYYPVALLLTPFYKRLPLSQSEIDKLEKLRLKENLSDEQVEDLKRLGESHAETALGKDLGVELYPKGINHI